MIPFKHLNKVIHPTLYKKNKGIRVMWSATLTRHYSLRSDYRNKELLHDNAESVSQQL